jgi:hypothetical protein
MTLWQIYDGMQPGVVRRKALLAWLSVPTDTGGARRLYVNNRWQANLKDADLAHLLKKGVLVRVRDRGARLGAKRQTYLIPALQSTERTTAVPDARLRGKTSA